MFQAQAMTDNLMRISKELAACQRKLARRRHAEAAFWGLTKRLVKVTVAIYLLSLSNPLAVAFAWRARKKRRYLTEPVQADPPIDAWMAAMSFDEVLALVHPVGPEQVKVTEDAKRYIAEQAAAHWVSKMNEDKHVAPSTIDLMQRYKALLEGQGLRMSIPLESSIMGRDGRAGRPGNFMKRWCGKFRKRWNLRLGKLSNQAFAPCEEVKLKEGVENRVFILYGPVHCQTVILFS